MHVFEAWDPMGREGWYSSSNQQFLSSNPNPPSFLQQLTSGHILAPSLLPPPLMGCRGSPPEGQGDEGEGAGNTGPSKHFLWIDRWRYPGRRITTQTLQLGGKKTSTWSVIITFKNYNRCSLYLVFSIWDSSGPGKCLKQPHVLKLHPDDPCPFFALFRRFAARDHQFAGAEDGHYHSKLRHRY